MANSLNFRDEGGVMLMKNNRIFTEYPSKYSAMGKLWRLHNVM
jgi:hypothetical protein